MSNIASKATRIIFRRAMKTNLVLLEKKDAATLASWPNNPQLAQFLNVHMPMDEVDEEGWVERLRKNRHEGKEIVLGIATHQGKLIGTMGLHGINRLNGTATTGALIGDLNYHGKGYGADAKMALLYYAFNDLNLRKINSQALATNFRSVAYLKKTGYRVEGCRKKEVWSNGEYRDMVLLAIFKEDFLPLWKKLGYEKFEPKPLEQRGA